MMAYMVYSKVVTIMKLFPSSSVEITSDSDDGEGSSLWSWLLGASGPVDDGDTYGD